jgi:2-keto-4-pentenoate hydratase/2-oxohepta-3-ene-1,7-dioic acid hydratase in catechol pathway
MRLCTVLHPEIGKFFGVEVGRRILRIGAAAATMGLAAADRESLADTLTYLRHLPRSEKALRRLLALISENPRALSRPAADGAAHLVAPRDISWLPPIEDPGKILCIGLNYLDHCLEQNKEAPKIPMVFNKFRTSLVGHEGNIRLPLKTDTKVDYEAELAVVIGRTARRVTKRTALKHVAGYTMLNDVTMRHIQATEKQWSRAKGFDGSAPCGPCLVTADEVDDPHALDISLRLNGKVMQKSNTSNLIFRIPELIAFITEVITLEPGDIISTGMGTYRNPQVYLKDGDVVEVRVDRLGSLRNTCKAD